jgi:phosphoglycolate phosphatase
MRLNYKLAGFDFDGTLADSADWFIEVLNHLAGEFHFKALSAQDREKMRGLHTREILKHLGIPMWKLPRIAARMRRLAARDRDQIRLFPGIPALFEELHHHGVRIAVISSNSEENVRRIFGSKMTGFTTHFNCGASLFGKTTRLKAVLRRFKLSPSEAIYVGDELRDAIAAREANWHFGGVAWGYSSPEALLAHSPEQFFTRVEEIVPALVDSSAI